MGSRLTAVFVFVALGLFLLYSSIYVVDARQNAAVTRFGEVRQVKTTPGIGFKMPFSMFKMDTVWYFDKRARRFDLEKFRVQVNDGKFYEVDAFVVYNLSNVNEFLGVAEGDFANAESLLRSQFEAALRGVYGLRSYDAALSEERASMMRETREALRPAAANLGLAIIDVRILSTDLTNEVSEETFVRMRQERLAGAELIRASGREQKQRIQAIADRQVIELESEARRESEVLRGEGDAERNRIFGEAFQRDPEFFEFYRSMAAYSQALSGNSTTLVLSPDSPFFRYFNNINGGTPSAPPPAPAVVAPAAPAAN